MGDVSKELRQELNALSKELFGVSSKWRSILDKEHPQLVTRKSIETIKNEDGTETTKENDVPVLTSFGAKQSVMKRYTVEEVRTMLLDYKKQRDDFQIAMQKQQEEKMAKIAHENALKSLKDNAQGSARA